MAGTAQALGTETSFEFEGKTWLVRVRSFEEEALFERWCESQARQAIARHAGEMAPQEYQLQLDGWRRDCAAQLYDFDGPHCMLAALTKPGQKELAYNALLKNNREQRPTRDLIDRLFKDAAALAAYRDASAQANADPNPTSPAGADPGRAEG